MTAQLDKATLERLGPVIRSTWEQIAPDVEDGFSHSRQRLTNSAAIETTIDANRLELMGNDREADRLVSTLCREHGYGKVHGWLCRNIKLV